MNKFDYKSFSESMTLQAMELIPTDISDEGIKYLIKTIENFSYLAGEAIENDTNAKLSLENKTVLTQIVTEWTFHKCVDLARSDVPVEYWDGIMQKIAFTIYEIAKQGMMEEVKQDDLLAAVEHHVVKVWEENIRELENKKHINKDCASKALNLSNIDEMSETFDKTGEDLKIETNKKPKPKPKTKKNKKYSNFLTNSKALSIRFLAFSALFITVYNRNNIKNLFSTIDEHILPILITILLIGTVIGLIIYFTTKKEIKEQLTQLDNVKEQLQELVNPDRMYERLGVDILCLQVGEGLLPIADPDQDGILLAQMAALRQVLTDELGYIIPNIRIMDCSLLDNDEYCISVRNNKVATGFVYPNKCMINADEWDSKVGELPEKAFYGVDPVYNTQTYWIDEDEVEDIPNLTKTNATNVIIKHIKSVVIKYVDSILTTNDINKYIEQVKSEIEVSDRLQKEDLRKIFASLIKEEVSIKDIILILDRLNDFSRTCTDCDKLSEKIRQILAQQICLKHSNESQIISAIKLDEKWKIILENKLEWAEEGKHFYFTEEQKNELIENTATALMKAHQEIGEQPVIICPSKVRLPLYRLLVDYIPTVVVLSESEILPSFKVDEVGIIEKY